jgi:hypothetical protein
MRRANGTPGSVALRGTCLGPRGVRKAVGIRPGPISGDIVLGCNVYLLIDELCGERLPAINLAHVDLASEQSR